MRDLQHGKTDIASIALSRVYIYTRNKQVSRKKQWHQRAVFRSFVGIYREAGWNFFFKASQESKHLLVGCCTKLVPVDVRVLLPRLYACACAHNKRSSTPGSVFFNQSGSASISLSFSLSSIPQPLLFFLLDEALCKKIQNVYVIRCSSFFSFF